MAVGVPIVGVAEGGVAETIQDNVTGVLAPREPISFGQAIKQLLDEPARAEQYGQAARQEVLQRWTWDRHIEQLETYLYQTANQTASL
jgi:glycosyltransferase involved in cell wall biosynthesis